MIYDVSFFFYSSLLFLVFFFLINKELLDMVLHTNKNKSPNKY